MTENRKQLLLNTAIAHNPLFSLVRGRIFDALQTAAQAGQVAAEVQINVDDLQAAYTEYGDGDILDEDLLDLAVMAGRLVATMDGYHLSYPHHRFTMQHSGRLVIDVAFASPAVPKE